MTTARPRKLRPVPDKEPRMVFRTIHGYRRAFRMAGSGPALLLIHGIGDNSSTWTDVIPHLAEKYTVIAPDLLGHGRSDKPRADYSVAAYANGMRDLLSVLGIDKVTVVGHSLGGGVAMQFAYQFPGRVERLVLVSSGGVTKDVHPVLRMVSVPVVSEVLKLLRIPGAMPAMRLAGSALGQLNKSPLKPGALLHDASDLVRILGELPDPTACQAYLRTLRAVVDWRGQVVTMLDRSYLTEDLPVQLIWGDRDSVIPVGHAYLAHSAMPGSRLEVFRGAGHFPFRDDPLRFLRVVENFLDNTAPLQFDEESWRKLLVSGVSESRITGGPATRMAVLDVMESDERSAT
ncbi:MULTISPECIES: alpha/beta fold hydrolase [unclassified Rhodococcus (in: high G+C Gram-positive bacteria)]|uniref:alpha/beta fold hydrolase n=1 Tax=unclassified Rhodococcus (in: high G+C Gram-positive bacteria) TaxID=192944 RepID=UPI00146A596A|nr:MULTISPECIES: alpha/beta hydrolase [unclassified Rhodococcus (in: high G+C Gram-positive bacteria)]MBF0663298.1 alpha/beta hydrolase [Rhodococcus sp. (in: high G+C Gram-positive bacteria)]NMD95380.1 alpha/beta hydrolase [Rhodococcus sp. BL-253-APC-6A1W]NME79752.1 alpha/beta hydrolase [Rhodococcus sp. 105337]